MSRYTASVDDAVLEFQKAAVPVSKRSVQRYCSSAKLSCVAVDPDTHEPTEKHSYTFLIDPSSIPKRIQQLREKREFLGVSGAASGHAESRHDTPGRDEARPGELRNEQIENLQKKLGEAEFEKAVAYRLARDRQQEVKRLGDMLGDARELIGNLKNQVRQLGSGPANKKGNGEVDNFELDKSPGDI